jgi:hypothetical protein
VARLRGAMANDLKALRHELAGTASSLFDLLELPFDQSSELERQVVAAFAFGMTFALGQRKGLAAPEIHALALALMCDVFKYSDHQAAEFTVDLIAASSGASQQQVMSAIIHRGIDGDMQWERNDLEGLTLNLADVLERARGAR